MAEAIYLDFPFGISVDFQWHVAVYEDWEYTGYIWPNYRIRYRYEYTDPRPRNAVILMIDAGPYGRRIGGYYDSNLLQVWEDKRKAHFEKRWDTLESFFLEMEITPPQTEQLVKITLRLPVAYKLWYHEQHWFGYWQTTDRHVIAEVSYLNVDSTTEFISVPPLPPAPPQPIFITDLCRLSKDTVAPTENITFTLVIENKNEHAGAIYIGYLCEGRWVVMAQRDIAAYGRLDYGFAASAQELVGKAIIESRYLAVDLCAGYMAEGIYNYRPETITGRWRVTLAVLVGEQPPIPPPAEGIKIPAWVWPVGAMALGGGLIYAGTRRR